MYQELSNAPPNGRRDITRSVVERMRAGDRRAGTMFHGFCATVIRHELRQADAALKQQDQSETAGVFSAHSSATFVRNRVRTQRYLQAISRSPQSRSVIDAGAGSSAVLAIGAALWHPQAEVLAYEINPLAARCAKTVVSLCGLADRISVLAEDALTAQFPAVDLAVTETFNRGGFDEPGVQIAGRLAAVSSIVIPDRMIIYGQDAMHNPTALDWHQADELHFADQPPRTNINGSFTSLGFGKRDIYVAAAYYDHEGTAILKIGDDQISGTEKLGSLVVPHAGYQVTFNYEAGTPRELAHLALEGGL